MKKILFILLIFINSIFANSINSAINNIQTPHKSLIKKIYSLNKNSYLWINRPNQMIKVTNALSNGYFNYKNKSFNQEKINNLLLNADSLDEYNKAKLDVLLTDAYLKLLKFIRVGDVDWNMVKQKLKNVKRQYDIDATWEIKPKGMPSAKTIYNYIKSGKVNALLSYSVGLKDRYKSYIDLLQYYRQIPEFSKVPYGPTINYGAYNDRIYQIKRRLTLLGDYPRGAVIDGMYDKNLAYAIRKFRKRFNLQMGDYIDNKLLAYINREKSYYIDKIITNLDKTKLYPSKFENVHVEVNVPEFKMRLYQNGTEVFASDIVVGKLKRPTPIFSDKLEYIVVNPTWTIPENLVKKDVIPALKRDPSILEKAEIKAYQRGKEVKPNLEKLFSYQYSSKHLPYQFVQKAGPKNALGRIKFMFPNKYAVYLHDTPNKGLFSRRYRYNSSGCMRMGDPNGFFNALQPYLNTNQDIDTLINSGKTRRISFKQKIPVHIVYFTLELENGAPKFLYDAYMYDKIIEESTQGNKKRYFKVPAVRLKRVNN